MQYQDDYFNPSKPNDVEDNALQRAMNKDKGLNYLKRRRTFRTVSVPVYTSGCAGTWIRDAETGEECNYKVGSKEEDLFFKVAISTGECTSANKSNTLFFLSPQAYEQHTYSVVDEDVKERWRHKRVRAEKEYLRKRASQRGGFVKVR